MLEIESIDTFYGDTQALWGVSLSVQEREIVSIIGSNGAGKSTTLQTISGLIPVRSGRIIFLGETINELPPHQIVEKGIAHVPEGREIFPKMTVYQNLLLGAYTKRKGKNFSDSFGNVYDLFPVLKERSHQLAGTLSGGEQQMLVIGRGLMSNPRFLMLDEPSLGLAPLLVTELFEVTKAISGRGVTVLLVEQNVHEALDLSDRAYVLETGRVMLEGKGKDLMDHEHVKRAFLGI